MIKHSKELYGLIGYPVGHSFSEIFFNQKFESEIIDAHYVNFEIPSIDEIKNVIKQNKRDSRESLFLFYNISSSKPNLCFAINTGLALTSK